MEGIYRHYKGGIYSVIGIGKHTETEEDLVFYMDTKGKLWVRPVEMFKESVKYGGKVIPRFSRID